MLETVLREMLTQLVISERVRAVWAPEVTVLVPNV